MLVSSKGRYALRVMLELAENAASETYLRLDTIAEAQEISEKYLEGIVNMLMKAGLIEGHRGRGGGYRLTKAPELYSVGEILRITDGSLAPIPCLDQEANPCERAGICKTLPMWERLDSMIEGYLDSISLSDLM